METKIKHLILSGMALAIFSCKEASTDKNATNSNNKLEEVQVIKHSTKPEIVELKDKMVAFRKSLSEDLLNQGSSSLNSGRFYLWHNTPANTVSYTHLTLPTTSRV